ncbi:hypothetical protein ACHQM5_006615 [Ranunculus cassubicifolius]
MRKQPSRCLPNLPKFLYPLLVIAFLTVIVVSLNVSFPKKYVDLITNPNHEETISNSTHLNIVLPFPLYLQISRIQNQIGDLLEKLRSEKAEDSSVIKFADQLLGIQVSMDKFTDKLSDLFADPPSQNSQNEAGSESEEEEEEEEVEETSMGEKILNSGVFNNYTSPKANRKQGKKNFLGLEAVNPSIGLSCIGVSSGVDRFMSYKKYGICPDDWVAAQKLILSGCDPLPRRKCFSRSPPHYSKPLPIKSSLWTSPTKTNILWKNYKCKDYSCLISDRTIGKRGFFKCSDCFDLSKRGWMVATNETDSAEFTIDEVLKLKPGEIRIGLDFSPTTGTFAAIMRERNVTIASATLNLGAPFNEVIALRGLLPLYVSIGSRLPFFDNTLDIIHSTLFLDGWIGFDVLQYVLFDWDRILRPKGILWIDRFFCSKEDMKLYLGEFEKLKYKKLLWRVVPKTDKQGEEMFFSAVLEKPIRGSDVIENTV